MSKNRHIGFEVARRRLRIHAPSVILGAGMTIFGLVIINAIFYMCGIE